MAFYTLPRVQVSLYMDMELLFAPKYRIRMIFVVVVAIITEVFTLYPESVMGVSCCNDRGLLTMLNF